MSIKICVITPISHLAEYGSLGEMDMSLTHMIIENPKGAYVRYCREQREKGRFVILDNSAFEMEQQGKGLDPDPVLDAALLIDPSEVIATDVLFQGEATVASTKYFIERMKARGVLGKYQVMAVPQGRNMEEWWDCLEKILAIPKVDTIGLSKLSVPVSYFGEKESSGNCARSRIMVTEMMDKRLRKGLKPVHLLGGDNWTPWEMKQQVTYPWIRSNDSSCAVWYGMHNRTFNEEGKIDEIITKKPDLENEDPNTADELDLQTTQILENIVHWHMACK
jgi:hypothetical protein